MKNAATVSQKLMKPDIGSFKCKFDVAWEEQRGVGGVGVMIRNDRGDFVAAMATRHVAISSPQLADTMAARDAAFLVKERQLQAAVFGGDALLVMVAQQHDGHEDFSPSEYSK